jgi:hypothetical protein
MTKTLCLFGKCALLISALSACSPTADVSNTKPATSSSVGGSGSNTAPIGGSNPAPAVSANIYTAGQVYGSCLQSLNSSFVIEYADSNPTYPITSCSTAGEPTCAAGFQLVYDTPVQMNCSSAPSGSNVVPCYYKMNRCIKNQDAQANTNYVAGTSYGVCMRKMNGGFQATEVAVSAGIITNCSTTAADPTCPAGFRVVSDTPTQMNCSSNPSATVENCYYKTQRCVKI